MTGSPSLLLEATFGDILTQRMCGIPIVNSQLAVEAIGFHEWNNYQLGILITPWFMNLMLIPDSDAHEPSGDNPPKVGSTQHHVFPSGSYEFVVGFEEDIGYYQSCSLFSPMFEFAEQSTAALTAREALDAIMDSKNIDIDSQNPATEVEQIWRGEIAQPIAATHFDGSLKDQQSNASSSIANRSLSERLQEPTSRRGFLQGQAFKDGATDKQKSDV